MSRAVPLTLLLAIAGAAALSCPDSRQCYCFEESASEQRVHCAAGNGTTAAAFDLTLRRHERLLVECTGGPDWADFLLGSPLDVGSVKTLVFAYCAPPGSEHSPRVAGLLGTRDVEVLRFNGLNGSLGRHDLADYPSVKNLALSNNNLTGVGADLLRDLPSLRLLELRSTNIQLPTGFFDNSSSLRILELGSNQLRQLEPGTFDGLHKLELLNLWKNDFRKLEADVFRGLNTLQSLDLNQNGLKTLPADIFKDLENLELVNLNSNNFTSLPQGLFRTNLKLRVVKLQYNKRNLTELPDGLFANLTALKSILITRNGLLRLPEDLFWGSTSLRNLTIDRNYLTTLPRRIFQNATELYILSLSFNDLKELPDGIFEATSKLAKLDLSKNHLTSINDRMLVGLESLRMLNLENNDLTYIHVNAFSFLGNLRVAKFAYNRLTLRTGLYDIFGHISPFHHCHSLEELYLAHNNVTEMHSDWIVSNTRLRVLDLKYNSFNYLETEDLQFISSSVSVDLRHNNISRVVLARLELMAANQSAPRDVIVDIADNPIRCDCEVYELLRYLNGDMHPYVQNYVHLRPGNLSCESPDYIRGAQVFELKAKSLKCLVESEQPRPGDPCSPSGGACTCWLRPEDRALLLDCAARNLTRPPEWIDARAVAKVELDLTMNELKEPPSMYKKGYEKVTSLNLAKNRISVVDERLLSPNLKTLLLDGNNLTSIDSKILDRLSNSSHITKLTLHDNPWRCDCNSRNLLSFIQSNSLDVPELLRVTCSNTNVSLSNIALSELCTSNNDTAILVCSMVSLLGLLVGGGAALYFRFQRQIKVWLFSKSLCLCLVSEEEIDRDKRYDAFISYSHKDEEFVVKELVGRLEEGPRPYRLCIHVRDWLAGEWIPTQIARSVEESKRTIVVLSANFIESVWGRLEFQVAHKQALSERRARVIVVLYGDIGPTEKLDPELRAYLQMNTYVKWGDPWFWQKLRYAMPHTRTGSEHSHSNGILGKGIVANAKAREGKLAFAEDVRRNQTFVDTVKGIDKNLNGGFDIGPPQCTTV
ncbi:PREDICTED: protein toll-like [Ceratosolen solmsi marchali]|uniref:Protein toll-like n=1 Tax=Ceratosolen solmsi marchali TaxID=326594 RepID=A0AAJ6YXQ0_9HYME|nr:PREDICTED: protein toll-like [Ceratosolen solmsi marchali]